MGEYQGSGSSDAMSSSMAAAVTVESVMNVADSDEIIDTEILQ